ncbi:hypothetical protein [Paenibacillus sp. DMB5]|uniref:hypothetical protein n=1 Tax=Paenibacillus sp. DMB5 TaxID=1780103 RepID=UPI00076BED76|nr:hypothetical protein [Paenibacillus sp. DMB5]KUP24765.1 hypothetical protein AWJ19_30200 [Paenibacillus sp. DMB5]
MPVYIVLIYAFIVWLDPYGLLKQEKKQDFYICSALCLVSFVLAFSLAMHWEIPSPSPLIINFIKQFY